MNTHERMALHISCGGNVDFNEGRGLIGFVQWAVLGACNQHGHRGEKEVLGSLASCRCGLAWPPRQCGRMDPWVSLSSYVE